MIRQSLDRVTLDQVDDESCQPSLRPCPLCGSLAFVDVFAEIKRCKKCKLSLVNPLGTFRGENESEDYFLNDYLPLHLANRENSLTERRSYLHEIAKRYALPSRPRLLDVGCALGFMLQEARAVGWDASGVETSEFAARYASEHTGCEVRATTLENAAFASQSFDIVTLMDVIEHVPEPRSLVSEIYRILRPGGVLLIVTPNFGSFFVWLFGLRAYGVWPDQHIVYFQPSTISRLLKSVGFQRIFTGTKDFYAENLRRVVQWNRSIGAQNIKSSFGDRGELGKLRGLANRFLMHIQVGDKLIALARK